MYDKENNIELRKSTTEADGTHKRETIWHRSIGNMSDVARRLYFDDVMIDKYSDKLNITIHSYSELINKQVIKTKHVIKIDGKTVEVYNTVNKKLRGINE